MKFGFQIANTNPWPTVRGLAEAADRLSWDSVWPYDHLLAPTGDEAGECLEGWTVLAALAALTRRVRLGCLVTCTPFRNPALLAKMAATVDQVSGGRLILGLGAGWFEREYEAYGYDFPEKREASDRLEEAADLIRRLLRADGPVDFEGRYYRLRHAPFAPRSPHVPLLIGGGGEKRTLRTVARFGDVMNVFGSPDVLMEKCRLLEAHCREAGRDPAEIRRTVTIRARLFEDEDEGTRAREERGGPLGGPDFLVPLFRRYREAGAEEVILQGLPAEVEELERWDRLVLRHLDAEA